VILIVGYFVACEWVGSGAMGGPGAIGGGQALVSVCGAHGLDDAVGVLDALFEDEQHPLERGAATLQLGSYEGRWSRLRRPGQRLPS
jgi:hypothetical protein